MSDLEVEGIDQGEKVAFDRRGSTLDTRGPGGEALAHDVEHCERIRAGGQSALRVLRCKKKTADGDLPRIAGAYRELRKSNSEPGQ